MQCNQLKMHSMISVATMKLINGINHGDCTTGEGRPPEEIQSIVEIAQDVHDYSNGVLHTVLVRKSFKFDFFMGLELFRHYVVAYPLQTSKK